MALNDKAPSNVGPPPTHTPPGSTPENYANLVERYIADTGRLKATIKILSVTAVTAGVVGYFVGKQSRPADAKRIP
jgi:hypothetical protein